MIQCRIAQIKWLLAASTCLLLIISSACNAPSRQTGAPLSRLEPDSGTYFGVSIDWANDSAASFNQRLGKTAAVYVAFFEFPFNSTQTTNLASFMEQVAKQKGLALITLEPNNGLQAITDAAASDLADRLSLFNRQGIPVFLRFAHEMNGSWYPWGQQPDEYIRTFRMIAAAVHSRASLTAMLWSPNNGGGYPFAGGKYGAVSGNPDFAGLDTNKDGKLTMEDDMYLPYYPGNDAVDWVGMSIYHWGSAYPWGENEIPEDGKYVAYITGNYNGLDGDQRAVPDFYQVFNDQHKKPMAVTETAALYNPEARGENEMLIKQSWWRQVFDPQNMNGFPGIKMINWFEWHKFEAETNDIINWTVTSTSDISRAFSADLGKYRLLFSGGFDNNFRAR